MADYCLIIDGKPVETRETFAVLNPSTGAEAGRVPNAGAAELDAAVVAAKRAFPVWSGQEDATLRRGLRDRDREAAGDRRGTCSHPNP